MREILFENLSVRDTEIALLIHAEKMNKEIALEQGVSQDRIAAIVWRIKQRLHVRSRIGIALAVERAMQSRVKNYAN